MFLVSDEILLKERYKNIQNYELSEKENSWQKIKTANGTDLVSYRDIKNTGWKLVSIIPEESVLSPVVMLRNYSLSCMLSKKGMLFHRL